LLLTDVSNNSAHSLKFMPPHGLSPFGTMGE
jgi:hypothetical protein